MLAEAKEQLEQIDSVTNAPKESSNFSSGDLLQAQVKIYEQKIGELRKKRWRRLGPGVGGLD